MTLGGIIENVITGFVCFLIGFWRGRVTMEREWIELQKSAREYLKSQESKP